MVTITNRTIHSDVKKTLVRYGNDGPEMMHFDFIIGRFFHYLFLALVHGHKVSIYRTVSFQMVYTYIATVSKKMRDSVFFSSKAFGYSFYFIAESKRMKKCDYSFRTCKPLLKKIAEHHEDDIIYKLLRK